MENKIEPGQIYKHFKGDLYKIITLAKHSEIEEWMVVYERQTDNIHDDWKIWARPLDKFTDKVVRDGYDGPRFTYIGE